MIRFGVLSVSDRCSRNLMEDLSGQKLKNLIESMDWIQSGKKYDVTIDEYQIVPDEVDEIKQKLLSFSKTCDVVLTTGGTGLSHRDVTPEATKAVLDKECPGIVTAILMRGLQSTPMAALSCLTAGIHKNTLIVNLPGSVKAVQEGFQVLHEILPHAVALIQEDQRQIRNVHQQNLKNL